MRRPFIFLLLVIVSTSCLWTSSLVAQNDSTQTSSPSKLFRPQLRLNTGLINYYGDVGSLDGLSQSSQMNWGTEISLISPLNNAFDLRAFAFFGSITQEERLLRGNANFTTPIRMGGLSISYNFHHILPEKRTIEPYISLGITTFEFNPKTDLRNAEGQAYHYWSDGTIRNIDESALNSIESQLLERDFTYESDLRATGESSSLPYELRGVTVPIGVGVNLSINETFSLNVGSEFHYSFTDNLDDITESSNGRAGNDHFMFSSIGLTYRLDPKKKSTINKSLDFDFSHLEFEDEDSDGIADIIDHCPFTEEEVAVDDRGCPIDTDADGVADYLDEDLLSPEGTLINLQGSELTESEILKMYLTYKDSVGTLSYQKSQTSTADIIRPSVKLRGIGNGFRIRILSTNDLNDNDIYKILSIRDIRSSDSGQKVEYFIGEFKKIEEAYARLRQLESQNFNVEMVKNENEQFVAVDPSEYSNLTDSIDEFYSNVDQTTFRVQIGAYRYKLSKDIFTGLDNILIITGQDGLTRYFSGAYSSVKDAAENKIDLLLKGFDGAFVTAYRGGKRVSLKEAGAQVSKVENIEEVKESSGINAKFVKYSIQLGEYSGRVPADMLGKFFELEGVKPMKTSNESTKYVYKSFHTKDEAKMLLGKLQSEGFSEAQLIGIFNDQVISEEEADRLKSK